jgi:hypothetical protein
MANKTFTPSNNKGIIRKDITDNPYNHTGVFNIDNEIFNVIMDGDGDNKSIRCYLKENCDDTFFSLDENNYDLQGHLELNKDVVSDRSPDYVGVLKSKSGNGNLEYALAGWIKNGKKSKFLSLSIDLIEDF